MLIYMWFHWSAISNFNGNPKMWSILAFIHSIIDISDECHQYFTFIQKLILNLNSNEWLIAFNDWNKLFAIYLYFWLHFSL